MSRIDTPERVSHTIAFVEGSTKTTGERTIPLNQTAFQALRELQKINDHFPRVFSNAKGNPINPRNLNRAHDLYSGTGRDFPY